MRRLYICLGFVFVALGGVGALLPILPTVPFLLLASWCFGKGSERWRRWFEGTKLYQKHLRDYAQRREMTLRTKLAIVVPVSVMLIGCMVLVGNLWMNLVLGAVLAVKYWYFIFRIKTIPRRRGDAGHYQINGGNLHE